jgi:hypothetical protein
MHDDLRAFSEEKRQPSAANLPEAVGTYRAGGFNP